MKIQDGQLMVLVDGVERLVPLQDVASKSVVSAWLVPEEYCADRLFVSVAALGEPESVPACDLALSEFLGSVELEPSPEARLELLKAAKIDELNQAFALAHSRLLERRPEGEVLSWPQQVREAELLSASANAPTPLLSAIAAERGISVSELAALVEQNAAAFVLESGALLGRLQSLRVLARDAAAESGLQAIAWQ